MLTTTIHTNYYRKWKEKTSYTNLNVTKYKECILNHQKIKISRYYVPSTYFEVVVNKMKKLNFWPINPPFADIFYL